MPLRANLESANGAVNSPDTFWYWWEENLKLNPSPVCSLFVVLLWSGNTFQYWLRGKFLENKKRRKKRLKGGGDKKTLVPAGRKIVGAISRVRPSQHSETNPSPCSADSLSTFATPLEQLLIHYRKEWAGTSQNPEGRRTISASPVIPSPSPAHRKEMWLKIRSSNAEELEDWKILWDQSAFPKYTFAAYRIFGKK